MLIVLAGYAAFVPGLAIVYFHNRCAAGWPVLIPRCLPKLTVRYTVDHSRADRDTSRGQAPT